MSKKKKIVLIVLILLVGAAAIAGVLLYNSTHGECGNNLTWKYDGKGTLTISGTGDMWNYEMTGTGFRGEYSPPGWSKWRNEIDTIIVEDGVTSIGNQAFASYGQATLRGSGIGEYEDSLLSVSLPDSVISIGDYAFAGCTNLNELDIPAGVTYIGEGAFRYCKRLNHIELPEGVASIGAATFEQCNSLRKIDLSGVTSIGASAFNNCTGLSEVALYEGLMNIGSYAFANCTSLQEIVIPESVASIELQAFRDCTSLTEIYFMGDMPFVLYGNDGDLVWLDVFRNVTATACVPAYNDTWNGIPTSYLGGNIEWVPFYP